MVFPVLVNCLIRFKELRNFGRSLVVAGRRRSRAGWSCASDASPSCCDAICGGTKREVSCDVI